MEKYSWNFEEYAELWRNNTFDTVEECIQDAIWKVEDGEYYSDIAPNDIYIGKNISYIPQVDAESVLENIQEQASEFGGEVGNDWDAYDYKKQDEIEELSKRLSEVVIEWMKKYGYSPEFYQVDNIKKYSLNKSESE